MNTKFLLPQGSWGLRQFSRLPNATPLEQGGSHMSHPLLVAWWPKWDILTVGFLAVVMIAGTFLAGGAAAS